MMVPSSGSLPCPLSLKAPSPLCCMLCWLWLWRTEEDDELRLTLALLPPLKVWLVGLEILLRLSEGVVQLTMTSEIRIDINRIRRFTL